MVFTINDISKLVFKLKIFLKIVSNRILVMTLNVSNFYERCWGIYFALLRACFETDFKNVCANKAYLKEVKEIKRGIRRGGIHVRVNRDKFVRNIILNNMIQYKVNNLKKKKRAFGIFLQQNKFIKLSTILILFFLIKEQYFWISFCK